MAEKYHVPLTEFSAAERKEYCEGIKLLVDGDVSGLEMVLNVLQNSRPFSVPGEPERTLSWVTQVIEAYRNLGKAIRHISLDTSKSESELVEKLKKYDIILEENDEAPYQPLLDTLDRFQEIDKILREHEIENPEQLTEALETAKEDNEGYFRVELEKFENSF